MKRKRSECCVNSPSFSLAGACDVWLPFSFIRPRWKSVLMIKVLHLSNQGEHSPSFSQRSFLATQREWKVLCKESDTLLGSRFIFHAHTVWWRQQAIAIWVFLWVLTSPVDLTCLVSLSLCFFFISFVVSTDRNRRAQTELQIIKKRAA